MTEILKKLQFYMEYPFVINALLVGVMIALSSSLLGVILVLKRYSFIGDGLSHVAFGAMAIAAIIKLSSDTLLIMPLTIAAAILLLRSGKNTRIKGDAAVAMISVGSLALGYLLINIFSKSANISGDVCTTLFGSTSILTLSESDVYLCMMMSILVIVFFIFYYNRIFAVTFDESFAKATGLKADRYNLMIAVITAVIIVLAMNLVGSLLITALLIFPALSAMRIMQSFKNVVLYSAVLSVLGATAGMLTSILCSTPVGATIVGFDIALFLINFMIGKCMRR